MAENKAQDTAELGSPRKLRQAVIKQNRKQLLYTPTWDEVRRDSFDIGLYDKKHPLPYYAMADTYQCSGYHNLWFKDGRCFTGKTFDPGPCDPGQRQSWNWHLGKNTLADNPFCEHVLLNMDLNELDECLVHLLQCPPRLTRTTAQNHLQTDSWFQKLVEVMHRRPCKCGRDGTLETTAAETLETTAAAKTKTKISCYCAQEYVIDRCKIEHKKASSVGEQTHALHIFVATSTLLPTFPHLIAHVNKDGPVLQDLQRSTP